MRKQNKQALQKHVKVTICVENTQDIYLWQLSKAVERERTSGNPGRYRGKVQNLTGQLLGLGKFTTPS